MMFPLLGVNIDHIATIRNARGINWPDPVQAAYIAEQAGADSIIVHLREDRRHITERDVQILRQTINTSMTLEMAATEDMINIACRLSPNYCCLVPEAREELTTEGGLDILNCHTKIRSMINKLIQSNIEVSIFIDAEEKQIAVAADLGVNMIEIHTGLYAHNFYNKNEREKFLNRIKVCAEYGSILGLQINVGHGLDYHNIQPIAAIDLIREINIGHAIISRAVIVGLDKAVRDMKSLIQRSRIL
ncbi:pyridoxine 5'-phosphate synthase [Candidatus Schneideria nysicola]|nr:pyridoxine 5'-phosphate synthase [Candidatus Schneideria nysicola]UAJ66314.1 pyridoxine 5'-phosphate synthase [Candidatus Schneideria nysicola]